MRVMYFGTADFAVPALTMLIASPQHDVVAVVTQPDKPAGRGQQLQSPPVVAVARAAGVPVLQPTSLKDEAFLADMRALQPDVCVVAAYGKMLPTVVLEFAPHGCVNIHPSLLPKYRGAAPIHWAIINGDTVTGVSTMLLVEAMDAGDVLMQVQIAIDADETARDLHDRLAVVGAELLLETLDGLATGTITPRAQDHTQVSFAPILRKEDGVIDWKKSGAAIVNQIRGMYPWPGTYTQLRGKTLKIFAAQVSAHNAVVDDAAPGTIVAVGDTIEVVVGDGRVCLSDIQLEGKKRMSAQDFLRGYPLQPGERFE